MVLVSRRRIPRIHRNLPDQEFTGREVSLGVFIVNSHEFAGWRIPLDVRIPDLAFDRSLSFLWIIGILNSHSMPDVRIERICRICRKERNAGRDVCATFPDQTIEKLSRKGQ